jgi:hypothetical protein
MRRRGGGEGRARWRVEQRAGVFLVLLSLTGLGLLIYLRKLRVSALAVMVVGTLLVMLLAALAI